MRSPLLFFIVIFVLDMVLKNAKNKKKVEQARSKRTAEIKPAQTKNKSIMQTIKEEMEKELQKQTGKPVQKNKSMLEQKIYTEEGFINHSSSKELKEREIKSRTKWDEDIFSKPVVETSEKTKATRRSTMKNDIIKGIIFSEIISEPKSIQNQKKSM